MLDPEKAILMVIDVQERFADTMYEQRYLQGIVCAMKVAHLIGLPIIATEQAADKLGGTVMEVQTAAPITRIIQKETFSGYSDFVIEVQPLERRQVIVTGIEAHGCVWQTVHDFLQNQYEVFLVVDAISAYSAVNKDVAVRRCEREGAIPVTVEMMATELMRTAGHPKFREIIKLLTEYGR